MLTMRRYFVDTFRCFALACLSLAPLVAQTPVSGTRGGSGLTGITNDTNVTGTVSARRATLGWQGTLAKTRLLAATVFSDQANTYSTGLQDFSGASVKLPVSAGYAPTA